MRWLFIVNALGVVATAAYAGLALKHRVPVWGLGAMVAFFAALAWPFLGEYSHLGAGFRRLEGRFLERRRSKYFPTPGEPEIFTDAERRESYWRRRREPVKIVLALTVAALALLSYDVSLTLIERPSADERARPITNF